MAGVDFLLCTVLDSDHQIVSIHAGELDAAFDEACAVVDQIYRVKVDRAADLVIASAGGHPRDASVYQAQKAISSAARIVRPGGDIVLVAACEEGSGSRLFEEWMERAYRPDDITTMLEKKFVMGGHKAYQIVRDLGRARVYLLSTIAPGRVRGWFLNPLRDAGEIGEMISRSQAVSVLPQATVTLAEP
jgi:nickel-dependent lactate racemase